MNNFENNENNRPGAPRRPENNSSNRAEQLNLELFSPAGQSLSATAFEEKKHDKSTRKILISIVAVVLIAASAFFGAFYGMAWICQSAIVGDSDFLQGLIMKNSGITVNRADVDYISGTYISDSITLADKILESTVELRIASYNEATGTYTEVSNGSGVIISEDGLIVTNYHVVYGAQIINVVLKNGDIYRGQVLHLDEITDLAVVKITPNDPLTPATLADSDNAVTGQQVAAAGNPLGVGLSVSFGYVSHANRDINDQGGNFIQVDASVNPGNSGGGLYDAQGNLLGIITAKASGDNVDGIGYAIPTNRMLIVVNDLLKYGYVKGRPALGVTVVTVSVSTWDYFNQNDLKGYLGDRKYGVYIISSRYNSEIQLGDRIISCNGKTLTVKEELTSLLTNYKVGDKLTLLIERPLRQSDGTFEYETFETVCVLEERDWPDEQPAS